MAAFRFLFTNSMRLRTLVERTNTRSPRTRAACATKVSTYSRRVNAFSHPCPFLFFLLVKWSASLGGRRGGGFLLFQASGDDRPSGSVTSVSITFPWIFISSKRTHPFMPFDEDLPGGRRTCGIKTTGAAGFTVGCTPQRFAPSTDHYASRWKTRLRRGWTTECTQE